PPDHGARDQQRAASGHPRDDDPHARVPRGARAGGRRAQAAAPAPAPLARTTQLLTRRPSWGQDGLRVFGPRAPQRSGDGAAGPAAAGADRARAVADGRRAALRAGLRPAVGRLARPLAVGVLLRLVTAVESDREDL